MSEDRIEINLIGTNEALAALKTRAGGVERGARLAMNGTTLRILRRIKQSFGEPGKPQRRTSHLSRSIIRIALDENGAITGIVGSTLPYKTGYAAILENGGNQPGRVIEAKPGKVLAWFTGLRGLKYQAALASGSTFNQAFRAATSGALGKGRRRGGRRGKWSDVAFARRVHIPQRYQRAMPYMRPAFDEERPLIEKRFTDAIRKQLGLEEISSGLGEG